MRETLSDGQWVDVRERITHAQDKAIRRAKRRVIDDPTAVGDADSTVLRIFIRDWHVLDVDGNPIPLTDPDAIDRLPMDVADALIPKMVALYNGTTVPNSPTPPSSDG